MLKLATQPKLFQEIRKDFSTLPSLDNLKFWLIKRQFAPDAAEKAGKTYLATMRLVDGGVEAYDSSELQSDEPNMTQAQPSPQTKRSPVMPDATISAAGERLQEIFNLDEGSVVLTYPAALSAESYQDLADYLALFLRKAKRNADAVRRFNDTVGDTRDDDVFK
jgi:hypothetical protein